MAPGLYGADIEQLRSLSRQMGQAGTRLQNQELRVNGLVSSVAWKGTDGERFRREWSSTLRPLLHKTSRSLDEVSRMLRAQADEQHSASTPGGPSGGPDATPNPTTPWELGVQWLTGTGPDHQDFQEGDPFTETLRDHPFYDAVREDLRQDLLDGTLNQEEYSYSLSGPEGVIKYGQDATTLLTGGQTGNLASTFLGSHSVQAKVVSVNPDGSYEVQMTVTNSSTLQSAVRIPVIGYEDWYQESIGAAQNGFAEQTGLMSEKTQTITWTETIRP